MIVSLLGCVTFPFERLLLVWEVLHYPFAACLDLFLVQGSKSCLVVGSLCVRFGADLILPFLTVSLIEAQVLPTDGANCRVNFWDPSLAGR